MIKVEIRDSVFDQIKSIRKGVWEELCDDEVFFSELIEMLLMELVVKSRSMDTLEEIKKDFENKIDDYIKGGVPEWRGKENEI